MMPNDSEELVQRFLDQELSAEERVRFVVRLGRDEALRHRVIELEQLVLSASRLPRPAVPDGFVAAVMARTAEPARRSSAPPVSAAPSAPSVLTRLAGALWAPRVVQWNLAGAAVAACLALVVVGGIVAWVPRATDRTAAPTTATAATGGAAASRTPVLVRLVVLQPGARMVEVAGDFNGWDPARTPLQEAASGSWTVTIPLEPGRYKYMFVVDGQQWIVDPFAAEQSDDGFGSRNAVLDVRPPAEAQS